MVQTSGAGWTLAPALVTLLRQLQQRWPGPQWQTSPQSGTIGDQRHQAEGWTNTDHLPFMSPYGVVLPVGQPGGLVRALDVAADVQGVPGIVDVADAPDCEALFAMVNRMYAAKDPRVYPNGYAIYNRRITDWNNPGGFHAQQGDPHLYHLHISVSRLPQGFNSTAPWPIPATGEQPSGGTATPIPHPAPPSPPVLEAGMYEVLHNVTSNAYRAGGLGYWRALNGQADVANALNGPLCVNQVDPATGHRKARDVSNDGMQWWHDFYTGAAQ